MGVGGEQWVPGSGGLYLSGNLSHATQRLVVRSKRHRVEREGFPTRGYTECIPESNQDSPAINGCTTHRTNSGIRHGTFAVGEENENGRPLGRQSEFGVTDQESRTSRYSNAEP